MYTLVLILKMIATIQDPFTVLVDAQEIDFGSNSNSQIDFDAIDEDQQLRMMNLIKGLSNVTPKNAPFGSEEQSFGSSTNSQMYFNAIDKAHEILEHDKDLAEKVPSCVVVGMQSVGKSAILSRISGIPFPQDSEVCTRVAIELRLRRAKTDQDSLKPMMIKAGNSEAIEVDKADRDAVVKALKEAQNKVLNRKQFEEKLSVKVEKIDVNLPEVTLIDLPGVFFAKDDGANNLEVQVKDMIRDRVSNEMALILHVVPLNQDPDTVSTWRIVRDADDKQERTISVLTKADLAMNDREGKEILKKRLQKVLMDSQTSECFVVHGAAKSLEDEASQLSDVSNYIEQLGLGEQIKVGLTELNEYVEERMLEHIKEKIPEMRRLLENELSRSDNELRILGRKPLAPIPVALRDSQRMKEHLVEAYESFLPDFRHYTETMRDKIFEIDMLPLGLVDTGKANKTFSALYPHYDIPPELYEHYILAELYEHYILALEVEKIGEDSRAMINTPYVGKKTELEKWLQTFAKPLEEVLKRYIVDTFEAFDRKIFRPSIERGSSEPTKIVSKHLELQIRKNVIVKAKNEAMDYANFLVDSIKENTFVADDHYLKKTSDELKILDEVIDRFSAIAPQKMYFHLVFEIRAFFKTRTRILPETIQLHFTKALKDLMKSTKEEIGNQIMLETSLAQINEPSRSIVRRKFHLEREKKIVNALEEISLL